MKYTKKILFVLVLLLGFIVVINLFDENLNPEITAIVDYYNADKAEDDNALLYLFGMNVGENSDPERFGRNVYKKYIEYINNNDDLVERFDPKKVSGFSDLKLNLGKLGDIEKENDVYKWLTDSQSRKNLYSELILSNRVLLARFENLISHTKFSTIRNMDMYEDQFALKKLFLVHLSNKWYEREYAYVIDSLNRDIRFWLMVFSGDASVYTKLVSTVHIQNSFKLFSRLIEDCYKCVDTIGIDEDILKPLTAEQVKFDSIYFREFYYMSEMINNTHYEVTEAQFDSDRRVGTFVTTSLSKLFFKRNHTLNNTYKLLDDYAQLGKVHTDKYIKEKQQLDEKYQFTFMERLGYVYNPIGKFMFNELRPFENAGYNRAIYDIDVDRHLLSLKIQVYKKKLRGKELEIFIKNNPVNIEYSNATIPVNLSSDKKSLQVILPEDLAGTYTLTL